MAWLSLALDVAAADADALSDFLDSTGALAVTLLDAGDAPVLEPAPNTTPLWPQARIEALYELDADLTAVRNALTVHFAAHRKPMPAVSTRFIESEDWSSTWRQFSTPIDFGTRLRVAPRDAADVRGRVMLRLDPGLAFGTGTHATTALCLAWLATARLDTASVVDFGCGSGILGIAALLLGARAVTAVDHDPQARLATRENAAYNGLSTAQIQIVDVDGPIQRPAEIVIANILADPLIELAPRLSELLAPGGRLVLSGMRMSQWPKVRAAYPEVEFAPPCEQDEWIAVAGVKASG